MGSEGLASLCKGWGVEQQRPGSQAQSLLALSPGITCPTEAAPSADSPTQLTQTRQQGWRSRSC